MSFISLFGKKGAFGLLSSPLPLLAPLGPLLEERGLVGLFTKPALCSSKRGLLEERGARWLLLPFGEERKEPARREAIEGESFSPAPRRPGLCKKAYEAPLSSSRPLLLEQRAGFVKRPTRPYGNREQERAANKTKNEQRALFQQQSPLFAKPSSPKGRTERDRANPTALFVPLFPCSVALERISWLPFAFAFATNGIHYGYHVAAKAKAKVKQRSVFVKSPKGAS